MMDETAEPSHQIELFMRMTKAAVTYAPARCCRSFAKAPQKVQEPILLTNPFQPLTRHLRKSERALSAGPRTTRHATAMHACSIRQKHSAISKTPLRSYILRPRHDIQKVWPNPPSPTPSLSHAAPKATEHNRRHHSHGPQKEEDQSYDSASPLRHFSNRLSIACWITSTRCSNPWPRTGMDWFGTNGTKGGIGLIGVTAINSLLRSLCWGINRQTAATLPTDSFYWATYHYQTRPSLL